MSGGGGASGAALRGCRVGTQGGRGAELGAGVRLALLLKASYGFAHGSMTSLVAQFSSAPHVTPAAGGVAEHDRAPAPSRMHLASGWRSGLSRAPARVTAHASCGRLPAAFGGHRKSKAGLRRAPQRRGSCGRAAGLRPATVRLCFPSSARGRAAPLAATRCLWSPSALAPSPHQRLTEADRSGGIKPNHTCCGPASSGLTPPAQSAWASPADAARDPGHNTLVWCEGSTERGGRRTPPRAAPRRPAAPPPTPPTPHRAARRLTPPTPHRAAPRRRALTTPAALRTPAAPPAARCTAARQAG